ncbi:MAG TPA: sigma-70 family RNA polymerase sigma factor [Polyangiaceae bacterium]|nr:sigma-70 family RNA polymerase sigma factor [Polyangiaceae bacterium]
MPTPELPSNPDDSPAGAASAAAYRALCEAHVDFVWRFAAIRGVETSAIDYLVRKVFSVMLTRFTGLEEASELRIAIAGITRNVVRGFLRQISNRSPLDGEAERGGGGSFDLGPVEALGKKSPSQLVDLIMDQLSEPEREVFVLCEVEGFSLAETAAALLVSEETLLARLKEARRVFNAVSAQLRAELFWKSRDGDGKR